MAVNSNCVQKDPSTVILQMESDSTVTFNANETLARKPFVFHTVFMNAPPCAKTKQDSALQDTICYSMHCKIHIIQVITILQTMTSDMRNMAIW